MQSLKALAYPWLPALARPLSWKVRSFRHFKDLDKDVVPADVSSRDVEQQLPGVGFAPSQLPMRIQSSAAHRRSSTILRREFTSNVMWKPYVLQS